jgi:hypothetical protein
MVGLVGLVVVWSTALLGADGKVLQQVAIDAKFVSYDATGRVDVLLSPKLVTLVGKKAEIVCGEDRVFPDGQARKDAEKGKAGDKVFEGIRLEVATTVVDGGLRLVGRGTVTDVLDTVETNPPNEGPGESYAVRSVVTPFALMVVSGGDYAVVPGAKRGENRTEIWLRARLLNVPQRDYHATMTVQPLGKDVYLAEFRVFENRPGVGKVLVGAPQIAFQGATGGEVHIGHRADGGVEVRGKITAARKKVAGNDVVEATIEYTKKDAVVWRETLQSAVPKK